MGFNQEGIWLHCNGLVNRSAKAEVTERRFDLVRETGIVPGILWTPAQQDRPVPLVLMGHGGSGHKRADRQLLGGCRVDADGSSGYRRAFARGPRPAPLDRRQYQERMAALGVDKVTDGMVDD